MPYMSSNQGFDLAVIGEDSDRPLVSEHVRRILETTGVAPFVRRHRTPLVAGGVVAELLIGSAGYWWVSRPVPLPDSVATGDYVLFDAMGAYTVSSRSSFNGFYPDSWALIE